MTLVHRVQNAYARLQRQWRVQIAHSCERSLVTAKWAAPHIPLLDVAARDRHGVGGERSGGESSGDEDSGDEDSGDEDSDKDSGNGRKSKTKSKTTTSQTSKLSPDPLPAGNLPPPVAPASSGPSPSSTSPATLTPTPPLTPSPTPTVAALAAPTASTVTITPTPPSSGIAPGEQSSSTTTPSVSSVQTTIITSSQSQAVVITSDSGTLYTSSITSSEPNKIEPQRPSVRLIRRLFARLVGLCEAQKTKEAKITPSELGSLLRVEEPLLERVHHQGRGVGRRNIGGGKTPRCPEPQEGRSISARFSSLHHSISKRSSRKPSPRRKSAVSAVGIGDDSSATKTNFAVAAPSAPLPVYHPLGMELSVPQYYHSHQPVSPPLRLILLMTSYAESSPIICRPYPNIRIDSSSP
ncbi:hypothetical protein IMY05_C4459000500 [Salix suchowensis]|nr:hypothetical protein IMY05_C4459000500 [Salix suchowensis]